MIEKNNIQKIMEFFYIYPLKETYLRELSRELNLSMPTIVTGIKKLGLEKLICISKEKALTKVKANVENPNFTKFKRVNNLEQIYKCSITEYLHQKAKDPSAIICFGSYSRGDDTEISDIDIAIIDGTFTDIDPTRFEKALKRKISIHKVDMNRISKEFQNNLYNGIVLEGAI